MVTVLVAEGGARLRNSIVNVLNNNFGTDCTVQSVKTGKEFIHAVQQDDFNLILLDPELPGQQWQESVRLLHREQNDPLVIPMAELSGFDPDCFSDDDSVLDFLLKPFSESELILTLEEAFRHCEALALQRRDSGQILSVSGDQTRSDIIRKKIERYIQEHYSEILSMQDVAKAMNYSDTHFCRLFKQYFLVNFSVYMNHFRVAKAKEMLVNTNHTVKEVGVFCGYRDTSYFIRVFKRFTGVTPSDYRITKLTMTAKKSNKS